MNANPVNLNRENLLLRAAIAIMAILLFYAVLMPLWPLFRQAFLGREGEFVGLANFIRYFESPALVTSITNTLTVSTATTLIAVVLGFLYAYAITRTGMRGKGLYRYIALLPLFAPTMMHGIALTYLFGNQGLVTTGLFGLLPGWKINLYGPVGIVISEVVYTFPQAFLILFISLSVTDNRLYEAAETMGASRLRQFVAITIPSAKYGIISALFVCFTLSFTDFGAPKVVGGSYNVLATDIYKQVIGQQNMTMGAVVGLVLTLPAIAAFVVDRLTERKQQGMVSARSTAYRIKPNRVRDWLFSAYCAAVAGAIGVLLLTVVFASFVSNWPYKLRLTLDHYDFSTVAAGGLEPFWNSLLTAGLTAVIGTAVTFVFAYLMEKVTLLPALRNLAAFMAMVPLALPGLVIGLAYILFFNDPTNPLHAIYGTVWILVLANLVHFYSVSHLTATSALKKLDREFEWVANSMAVPRYRLFYRVTVPMSLPALLEIAIYYFVNSMVTISAVVFLYSSDFKLASVMIVNMEDAGDTAAAAAMSSLVLGANIVLRAVYELVTLRLRRKAEV